MPTPFWSHLAQNLRAAGHQVTKTQLAGADLAFWRGAAVSYRGRGSRWPDFVRLQFRRHAVTDLILFGDCRPYHRAAIRLAQQAGVTVHVLEEGYVRPGFVTLEREGSNGYSRFPRAPDAIRQAAQGLAPVSASAAPVASFWKRASWDVLAQAVGLAAAPFFPHYRWHGPVHPLVEYAGWLGRFARAPFRNRVSKRTVEELFASDAPFFFMPLQLDSDYQIRVHSPFESMTDAVMHVIRSFAAFAPADHLLVFKLHPLDPGLVSYGKRIERLAHRFGVMSRVRLVGVTDLPALIRRSAGVVLVNSTVGITALQLGRRVKALGHAIYDIEGLCFGGDLDQFWINDGQPDAALFEAFLRLLMQDTQIEGDLFSHLGIRVGARNATARILSR